MPTAPLETSRRARQIRQCLRGGVGYFGVLDRISHDDFIELVESNGGRYVSYSRNSTLGLLVVGAGDLPITRTGDPIDFAGRTVIGEAEFLELLAPPSGLAAEHTFTVRSLAELLHLPERRLRAWIKAGLIRPKTIDHGVLRFDFRQAAIARTLVNLHAAGVTVTKLRQSLSALKGWLPDLAEPMQQLSLLEHNGPLLVRLESGELAEIDGQLRLTFGADGSDEAPAPIPIRPPSSPISAAEWHDQAIEQEQSGMFAEAEASYRQALLAGGPDAQIAFDLAHLLSRQGLKTQAIERYRVVVEIDPDRADAWNNLGVLLADCGQASEAIDCLRRAVTLNPADAEAHYNLASLLDAEGATEDAVRHYAQYVRLEAGASPWTAHARRRVAEAGLHG